MDGLVRPLAPLLLILLVAGCAAPEVAPTPTPATLPTSPPQPSLDEGDVALEPFVDGFSRPLLLTHRDDGALYVVEQDGKIWELRDGERSLWLDIDAKVGSSGNEQGLLGLAFEPGTRRAYVSYTDNEGDTVLARLHDGMREETILTVDQPYSNHNGGHVAFGPDGHLYFGLGDGGGASDPTGNGQDPDALLGSLLRLDVSGDEGYATPRDNPYADGGGAPEVWAKGLRNPWRFSFDRETDDLYIADVGQGAWEEIDFVAAGSAPGMNFGWPAFEAHERNALRRAFSEVVPPVHAYPLRVDGHCAIIGGHVYRGAASPALVGEYLFGDHCSGEIWALRFVEGTWRVELLVDTDLRITSFGEDADGEVYVVDRAGGIHRIVAS